MAVGRKSICRPQTTIGGVPSTGRRRRSTVGPRSSTGHGAPSPVCRNPATVGGVPSTGCRRRSRVCREPSPRQGTPSPGHGIRSPDCSRPSTVCHARATVRVIPSTVYGKASMFAAPDHGSQTQRRRYVTTFRSFEPFQPLARATVWWLLKGFQNLNIMFKVITDFGGYAGSVLAGYHSANHPRRHGSDHGPVPEMPAHDGGVRRANRDLQAGVNKESEQAIADTNAFNVGRAALEVDGHAAIGGCVNTVAKGNETIILSTGFPYYETGSSPDYSAPKAPTNLVLHQGDNTGEAVARYRPKRRNSMNEVQPAPANVEANWKTVGTFSGGKATLTGIIPGTIIWVRIPHPRAQECDRRLERDGQDYGCLKKFLTARGFAAALRMEPLLLFAAAATFHGHLFKCRPSFSLA
jgi:hypothetical protein